MEEVIYNAITYLIVVLAIFVASRKMLKKTITKKESSCSSGCGGCSTKCDLKELVQTNTNS